MITLEKYGLISGETGWGSFRPGGGGESCTFRKGHIYKKNKNKGDNIHK